MPASSEFVTLCQSQIALLTRGLGAALSIIYLTEELTDIADAKLVPVAAYPEAATSWEEDRIFSLLLRNQPTPLPSSAIAPEAAPELSTFPTHSSPNTAKPALAQQQQIILPLIHQEMMMGLLVTTRADRPWNTDEQKQIAAIADTLAIACVLDQRSQWLTQDLRQQRLLRQQKREAFDDLLHQFRNPLTALRTFGKLLVKRLEPQDVNRSAAEGIVRESDRLQDLLKQFDTVVALDEVGIQALPAGEIELGQAIEPEILEAEPIDPSHNQGDSGQPLLPSPNFLIGTPVQLEPHLIQEVLSPLLDSAEAIAQDRQLQLNLDLPTDLPPVQTDIRALREVLNNLIDNALKYTPAEGQVYIRVLADLSQEARQAIVIADTGPGIPPEDLTHLFERHYRGVQATTEIPGTGLGLAIARELVHQMQGEIQVFSPVKTSGLIPQLAKQPNGTAVVVWLASA